MPFLRSRLEINPFSPGRLESNPSLPGRLDISTKTTCMFVRDKAIYSTRDVRPILHVHFRHSFNILSQYTASSALSYTSYTHTAPAKLSTTCYIVTYIIALASASGAVTTQPQSAQGAEGPLSGPDTSEKIRSGGRRPPEVTRHK